MKQPKKRRPVQRIDIYKPLELSLEGLGLPRCRREYIFHPTRKWRIDFAWPDHRLAVEIEGGIWRYGRHNRAKSFLDDMQKYNALAISGFRLLRFTPSEALTGQAALTIKKWFDVNASNAAVQYAAGVTVF